MFESILDAMRLGDDEFDDYDDDDIYDDDDEEVERRSFFNKFPSQKEEAPVKSKSSKKSVEKEVKQPKPSPKITPMRSKGRGTVMEVCVIKPTSFEDAREISETLLADRTVLLNMKGIDLAVAQRLIDFTCGTCYAIEGNLQRVEDYIFIITPAGVELSGDLAGLVDSFDFAGIQTGF